MVLTTTLLSPINPKSSDQCRHHVWWGMLHGLLAGRVWIWKLGVPALLTILMDYFAHLEHECTSVHPSQFRDSNISLISASLTKWMLSQSIQHSPGTEQLTAETVKHHNSDGWAVVMKSCVCGSFNKDTSWKYDFACPLKLHNFWKRLFWLQSICGAWV